jgi:hypothetical protein
MNKLLILAPKPKRIISISSIIVAEQYDSTAYYPDFGIQTEQQTYTSNIPKPDSVVFYQSNQSRPMSSFN